MIVCPCCAGRGEIEERAPVPLSRLEFRIWDEVRRSRHGIPGLDLVEKIYDDRRDGGPDTELKAMHVTVYRMNKKLAPAGQKVASTVVHGSGGVYKLQRLA
jgi:hypothetical protein